MIFLLFGYVKYNNWGLPLTDGSIPVAVAVMVVPVAAIVPVPVRGGGRDAAEQAAGGDGSSE